MSTATREASLASSRRLSDVVLSSVVCSASAVQCARTASRRSSSRRRSAAEPSTAVVITSSSAVARTRRATPRISALTGFAPSRAHGSTNRAWSTLPATRYKPGAPTASRLLDFSFTRRSSISPFRSETAIEAPAGFASAVLSLSSSIQAMSPVWKSMSYAGQNAAGGTVISARDVAVEPVL